MKKKNFIEYFIKVTFVIFVCSISSCTIDGKGRRYPIPAENPVYFSSDAQTKNVYVDNIIWIYAENPEKEIVEETDTGPRWIVIENDWLRIRYGNNDLPRRTIEITVKENTTDERRFYSLEVSGYPPPIANIMLTIVQEVNRNAGQAN